MDHHTDEGHVGFGAAPEEQAPEEAREPAVESETAAAIAEEDEEEGAGDEEQEEDDGGDEDDAEEQDEEASVVVIVESGTANGTAPSSGDDRVELYTEADLEAFRGRWSTLLAGFVDDPRASAEQADALIGELVDRIDERRQQLHDALDREDDRGETEAMRQAIVRYRAIYRALVRE